VTSNDEVAVVAFWFGTFGFGWFDAAAVLAVDGFHFIIRFFVAWHRSSILVVLRLSFFFLSAGCCCCACFCVELIAATFSCCPRFCLHQSKLQPPAIFFFGFFCFSNP